MIQIKQKGSFKRLDKFLYRNAKTNYVPTLEKYGREGVRALMENTPKDTGTTANSWDFKLTKLTNGYRISWINSNIVNGVPIAVIIQYGHATKNGGYVEGYDYINPAMKPIFDKIAKSIWEEVGE